MTDDMMNLRALVEKTPDADLPREMIGFAAERLMELEVAAATGTGRRARGQSNCASPSSGRAELLPVVPGTREDGREGAGGGHPGSLCPGHLDALGR